jgi:hypothetical protein
MADENTHGLLFSGAGQTAAGEQVLGTLTLPADGPWIIHNVFGQIVSATATAAEATGGYMRFDAASGDIDPNPAPSKWPVISNGSALGATIDVQGCALQMYDVLWNAPGRATINCIFNNTVAATVAPQIVMGVLFGKSVPEKRRSLFCDTCRVTTNSAADTAIGTITLSEKAKRITGIMGVLINDGVLTTAEELIGFFRLASDDVNLVPAQYPFPMAYSAGLGALIMGGGFIPSGFIPVDIPVPGGARINCFVDLNTAVTTAAEVQVYLAFE